MKVNVKDGLPGVAAVVNDHSISGLIEPELFSEHLCNKEQMADQFPVVRLNAVDVSNMFFRHDQDMCRRLGIDVHERNGMFIFVNIFHGGLFFYDLAEYALGVWPHFIVSPLPRQSS